MLTEKDIARRLDTIRDSIYMLVREVKNPGCTYGAEPEDLPPGCYQAEISGFEELKAADLNADCEEEEASPILDLERNLRGLSRKMDSLEILIENIQAEILRFDERQVERVRSVLTGSPR